jgi:hypothetical protein
VPSQIDNFPSANAAKDYKDGKHAGRDWAEQTATVKELRRLADYCENTEGIWYELDRDWLAPFGATDYFVFAVWPKCKDDRGAPPDFWEQALGDDAHRIQDEDFFHGFGDGAIEVWNEIRDEL